MSDYDGYLGYIKLSGDVHDGIVDIEAAQSVLEALETSIKREIYKESPDLYNAKLHVPVRIRDGSWEALIPDTIGEWIIAGGGIAVTAYLSNAAKHVADNDFKDISSADIVNAAKAGLKKLKSKIELSKHIGSAFKKKGHYPKFKDNNRTLEIKGADGTVKDVSVEEFENYINYPDEVIEELARSAKTTVQVEVGIVNSDGSISDETITQNDRLVFLRKETEEKNMEVVLPELRHGEIITILGNVTKGNSETNTLGFKYNGHILTCLPSKGRASDYKPQMFKICYMTGKVQRVVQDSIRISNRPKIIFTELEIAESVGQQKLFEEQ